MATVKFLDADLINNKVELMVGIEIVVIEGDLYRSLSEALSKCCGIVKRHPLVGYTLPIERYDRYTRQFAKEAEAILKLGRV